VGGEKISLLLPSREAETRSSILNRDKKDPADVGRGGGGAQEGIGTLVGREAEGTIGKFVRQGGSGAEHGKRLRQGDVWQMSAVFGKTGSAWRKAGASLEV